MPSVAKKGAPSPRTKSRSRSSSRSRSKPRSTKSKSRSRSRSRGRSPSRKTTTKQASTPVMPKKSLKVEKPAAAAALTPRRTSARIAAIAVDKDESVNNNNTQESVTKKVESESVYEELSYKDKPVKSSKHWSCSLGCFLAVFALPALMYAVNLSCNKNKCTIKSLPKFSKNYKSYLDTEAAGIFVGWFLFQVVLFLMPIGKVVDGQNLKHGGKLQYRCNGFYALLVNILAFAALVYFKQPVTKVYDKFIQTMTTALLIGFVVSIFAYIKARRCPPSKLSPSGNSGSIFFDFFLGHELNPRIRQFDFKFFWMRTGFISLVLLDLIFVVKAADLHGKPSPALLLVTVFQVLYVADSLWFEESLLSNMDIIHDGFGYLQAVGYLAFAPFVYSLQSRYLLEHNDSLPWFCLASIAVLNFIGYFIYRGSNSQKNEFRRNPQSPSHSHLETIATSSGKKLLVSGWWGLCHKPNYLGDILMAFAWSLTCGVAHVVPYFYPVFVTLILLGRERRDNQVCKKKYRSSWDKYCERVKYRIFPYVY